MCCDVSASSQKNEDVFVKDETTFYLFSQNKRVVLKRKSTTQSPLFVSEPQKVLFKETPTSLRNHRTRRLSTFFAFKKEKKKREEEEKKRRKKKTKKGGGEEGEIFGHVDFTFLYARTQNDTHATRFEIIPGLLGVDCRRAIRLRRDHVLRVEGRRENHRRRHRRGAWRRLHTEGTFLLPLGEILIHFFRARARGRRRDAPHNDGAFGRAKRTTRRFLSRAILSPREGSLLRDGVLFASVSLQLIFVGRFCALQTFENVKQKSLFPLKGCRFGKRALF